MSGNGSVPHARTITLIRHGRTAFNAAGRLQGTVDIPLDATGRWQAARTGEALRRLYVDRADDGRGQMVVCSDLGRAAETAHAFADPLGLDVHPDARIRERGFGEWEGMCFRDIAERWPDDYRLWHRFAGGEMNHGAESKDAVSARGVAALNDWSSCCGENTDLFVFSHSAWIVQTLQRVLGLTTIRPDYSLMMPIRNAFWARLWPVEEPDGSVRWRLLEFNRGPAVAESEDWNADR